MKELNDNQMGILQIGIQIKLMELFNAHNEKDRLLADLNQIPFRELIMILKLINYNQLPNNIHEFFSYL